MDCCLKSNKHGDLPCCTDVRRCCFGKNHDAFFCYNYEKAKNCESPWHPRRPDIYYVSARFDNPAVEVPKQVEMDSSYRQPEPYRRAPSKFESYDSIPRRGVDFDNKPGCYCSHGIAKKGNKKTPGLKVAKEYLQRCLLQRLTVGWTEEDDRNLSECIFHHLAKIKGPDHVIEILDEISAQKKMEPVFRSWINQLKVTYSRPRGGDNSPENLNRAPISSIFHQSSEDSLNIVPYSIERKQYHIAGETDRCKDSLNCNSPVPGRGGLFEAHISEDEDWNDLPTSNSPVGEKFLKAHNYNRTERGTIDNFSNYNFAPKETLSEQKRVHLDIIPSAESTQSNENNHVINVYKTGYQNNASNEKTFMGNKFVDAYKVNNDGNPKNGTHKQSYLGHELRPQLGSCPSSTCEQTDKEIKIRNRSNYLPIIVDSDDENTISIRRPSGQKF